MSTLFLRTLGLVVVVCQLNACASTDSLRDPAYAPAAPVQPTARLESDGSIYHASSNRYLFEDVKARRVGDILTVLLEENTNASKSVSTTTSKSSNVDVANATLFGGVLTSNGRPLALNEISSATDFSGAGDSSQSNSLDGTITVTIAGVLPNGNLAIRGEKLLNLNQGSEIVRVSGIVRPTDISTANTVASAHIAHAEITYSGHGALSDSNKAGWITRFFNSGYWPF